MYSLHFFISASFDSYSRIMVLTPSTEYLSTEKQLKLRNDCTAPSQIKGQTFVLPQLVLHNGVGAVQTVFDHLGAYLTYLPKSELHSARRAGTYTLFRLKCIPLRDAYQR